jgi:hypothetical protein
MSRPVANVYIDGFNLYRRALEGRPEYKWLNIVKLAEYLLPDHDIGNVRYFTALLRQGLFEDVQTPVRQQMYLRALATEPRVDIKYGRFRNDKRDMPVHPQMIMLSTMTFVKTAVRKREEKGSDVNLASRMVADAFRNQADIYVLLSNDSDQVGPMKMMKQELGFSTGLIFPTTSAKSCKELVHTGPDLMVNISDEALAASQFPSTLKDQVGQFHRPKAWKVRTKQPLKSEGPAEAGPSNR